MDVCRWIPDEPEERGMRRLRQRRRPIFHSLLIATFCLSLLSISGAINTASAFDIEPPINSAPPADRATSPPTVPSSQPTGPCSFYVSPSGSDLNAGGMTEPFLHV